MIEEKRKTVMTCDFCGKEIDYDSYPKSASGREVEFSIALEMKVKIGASSMFEPISCGTGHMCGYCLKKIEDMTDWFMAHR